MAGPLETDSFNTFGNFKQFDTDKKAEFSIKNVDVSIVNSIRRTIQSNVQNVAFFFDAKSVDNPDVKIIKNDSPLHNEFLSQRLSMIPIHFKKKEIDNWQRDDYSFEINQKNNSNTFMNITSEHITVKRIDGTQLSNEEREQLFPKNAKTKDHILITKLPPATLKHTPGIEVNLRASLGCGQKHSCFSPTSLCTYMNKIVEGDELKNAEKNFVEKYLKQFNYISNLIEKQAQLEFKKLNNNFVGEALKKAEEDFTKKYLEQFKYMSNKAEQLKFNDIINLIEKQAKLEFKNLNNDFVGKALKKAEEDFTKKYLGHFKYMSNQAEQLIENEAKLEFENLNNEALKQAEKDFTKKYLEPFKKLKEQAKLKFDTLDKQRYYEKDPDTGEPNHFVFKLESECALLPFEIFSEAIGYILSRIDKLIQAKLDIKDIDKDQYEITIHDESHTIGNLIQALVYNKFVREDGGRQISFIGYFVTHPLENTVCVKITSTLSKEKLADVFQKDALGHIRQSLEDLRDEWENVATSAISS